MDNTTDTSDLADAAKRPLGNFDLDRYWSLVFWEAIRQAFQSCFGHLGWKTVIAGALALLAAVIQFSYIGWDAADKLKILGSSFVAAAIVFVVMFLLSFVRLPCQWQAKQKEVRDSQQLTIDRYQIEAERSA